MAVAASKAAPTRQSGRTFYVKAAALLFLMITVLGVAPNLAPFATTPVDELTPLLQKQVDVYLGVVQLLVTLTTAVCGGLMALIYTRYSSQVVPAPQMRRLVVCWALAALSLLSGYFAYQNLLDMLANRIVDFTLPSVKWPERIQFLAFLSCIVVAGEFVWEGLREVKRKAP